MISETSSISPRNADWLLEKISQETQENANIEKELNEQILTELLEVKELLKMQQLQ